MEVLVKVAKWDLHEPWQYTCESDSSSSVAFQWRKLRWSLMRPLRPHLSPNIHGLISSFPEASSYPVLLDQTDTRALTWSIQEGSSCALDNLKLDSPTPLILICSDRVIQACQYTHIFLIFVLRLFHRCVLLEVPRAHCSVTIERSCL